LHRKGKENRRTEQIDLISLLIKIRVGGYTDIEREGER
jgi:hypothetical protein